MPRQAPKDGSARQSGVYRRADGRWQAKVSYVDPIGVPRRLTVTGATRDEVQARADDARRRLNQGMPLRDATVTVGVFASAWVASTLAASDRKATTKALYGSLIRSHVAGSPLEQVALKDLRARHVEAWIASLKTKGLAPSTIRQAYTVLRAVLDTAVRDGDLAVNPAAKVTRPRVPRREAIALSPVEFAAILDEAEGSRYAPLFDLLVNTGLRRGEALALRWADVDFERTVLRVRGTLARVDGRLTVQEPKTARSRRVVHMTPQVVAILRAVKVRQAEERLRAGNLWTDSGHVFTTEDGEPCDPRNALRAFTVAARRAGVPGVGLHTLRHTAASLMLSGGVPLKVVSDVLGHSSVAITGDVYGHVAPDVSFDAMASLSAALDRAKGA